MLPELTVPASLLAVLENLRIFTAPTYLTFTALVTGLVAQTGKGAVTGMPTGAGLARTWSHDRAHGFFSRSAWNAEILGIVLTHLIVRTLLPEGAAVTVAVDDTLFKRHGKKVFGAAWQHDGAQSATSRSGVGRASWWSGSSSSCRSAPGRCACRWPRGCGGPRPARPRSSWRPRWSGCWPCA